LEISQNEVNFPSVPTFPKFGQLDGKIYTRGESFVRATLRPLALFEVPGPALLKQSPMANLARVRRTDLSEPVIRLNGVEADSRGPGDANDDD